MGKRIDGSRDRETDAPPRARSFWLWAPAFVALIVATLVVDTRPAPLMRGLSLTLLGLAVLFGGLPVIQLRKYGAAPRGGSYMATTAVAQRGLYAVVRHPQYLGCDFLVWALATSAPHWGTILPAIAFTAGMFIQARAEERYLLEKFGDAYASYRRMVPRFGLLTGLVRYLRRLRHQPPATP
jgi:protein-S-isoprenylcysteine O-methyltransferase Ste14